jgi:galactarate dehydratase
VTLSICLPRAINEEVGKRLLEEMAWYDNYLDMAKPTAAPTLSGKKCGLANVVEKALGSIAKSGQILLKSFRASVRPDAA